jgi:hypothetical protein
MTNTENENYDPDTIGVARTLHNYGDAIEHMRSGGRVQRVGWNGKGMYVFKQVPSKVPAEYVAKMTSLPESVRDAMLEANVSPNYKNQMAIVTPDGSIDSWVASSSDTFAEDWIWL